VVVVSLTAAAVSVAPEATWLVEAMISLEEEARTPIPSRISFTILLRVSPKLNHWKTMRMATKKAATRSRCQNHQSAPHNWENWNNSPEKARRRLRLANRKSSEPPLVR